MSLLEQADIRGPGRRRGRPVSLARPRVRHNTARPLSGDREPDLFLSSRRLAEEDVLTVASQLGPSWRILGLRLNFDPHTLDELQLSAESQGTRLEALYMLKLWSQLPTATIGRLARVLWEMGKHTIAIQLRL